MLILLIAGCSEKTGDVHNVKYDRVNITENQINPAFLVGDLIGVYPVGYNNGLPGIPGDIAYPINVPLFFDGNRWRPQDEDYLFSKEEILDIYAYYPYDAELGSVPGKLNMTAYEMDLSVQQYPEMIDLLWAKSTIDTRSGNIIDLPFRHLFSKISLRLRLGSAAGETVRVEVHNLNTSATVNLASGNVTPGNDTNILTDMPVTAYTGVIYMCEAIVPPQIIESGTYLFLIYIGQQPTLYTTDRTVILHQGMSYTFDLTVNMTPEL